MRIYAFVAAAWCAIICSSVAADDYPLGPDSQVRADVPHGKIEHATLISKVYPGAIQDYWVYVPSQYDKAKPACVMVFQDGQSYVSEKGPWRATAVMDNLIARGEMPVTIGVFVDPGNVPAAAGTSGTARSLRSYQYDSTDGLYLKFLTEEMLPTLGKTYSLSTSGNDRAICGMSSGGICAFTAAWQRPDQFSRVVSFVGSFTDLRGGNQYPSLIRKTERKPIRVFQQDGNRDLNTFAGDWWLANQQMASAFKFAGYDYQFVTGTEGHNAKQGGAILPDAMRYIWKDWPKPVGFAGESKQPVAGIVSDGQAWEKVAVDLSGDGRAMTAGPDGTVYLADNRQVWVLGSDGPHSWGHAANQLGIGPDGRVYAPTDDKIPILLATGPDGTGDMVDPFYHGVDLVVDDTGGIFFTDDRGITWLGPPDKKGLRPMATASTFVARHLVLTPDHLGIVVAGPTDSALSILRVNADHTLGEPMPYYSFEPATGGRGGSEGMAFDTENRLYAAAGDSIEVFDQAGRVLGILASPIPQCKRISAICFGGQKKQWLYVCVDGQLFRRHLKATGLVSCDKPIPAKGPQ